jgi:2-polyprenyl-6-methoxyphenol hydroxylase-like FAD-dependent oxidoreductase
VRRLAPGPVVIVGGGPVGLFLALLLARARREVVVLEGKVRPGEHARSIGIHPPALEALAVAGAAEPLIDCGVAIERARVFLEGRPLGALSLESCPGPFRFVLSVPQTVTEGVLAEALERTAPGSLIRGGRAERVLVHGDSVEVESTGGVLTRGAFVVGCDGRGSTVRDSVGVAVLGRRHDHHYLMTDLPRTAVSDGATDLGDEAAIYLGRAGVVESFPLPAAGRRWVARTRAPVVAKRLELLARLVLERTGVVLRGGPDAQVTAFTAETRLAASLAGAGWALAGDAAHVVSPIGGQGLNLGLLGAFDLARALLGQQGGRHTGDLDLRLRRYDVDQRRRAGRAARRANLNMTLGGERTWPPFVAGSLRVLLAPPVAPHAARYFMMRGL